MLDLSVYDDGNDRLSNHTTWDFLVAPGVARQKDGSLLRVIEVRGRDLDSSEESEFVSTVNALDGIFAQFGTGWCLHVEAQRRTVAGYPDTRTNNNVARMMDGRRQRRFAGGQNFSSRYFVSVTWLPPSALVNRLERFFLRSKIDQRAADAFRDVIEPFLRATDIFADLLNRLMAWAAPLDDDGLLTYLHSTISPHNQRIRAPRYKGWPIDQCIPDTPFVPGSLPFMKDYKADYHIRAVSVLGYPEVSYPDMLSALDRLPFEYRFVLRMVFLSLPDAQNIFKELWERRKHNKYTWMEYLYSLVDRSYVPEADPVAMARAMEAQLARGDVAFEASTGFLSPTLVVWDADRTRLEGKLDAVTEVMRAREFGVIIEGQNAWRAIQASLPGEVRANLRRTPLPAIHAVHMMPLSSAWTGPERNEHLKAPVLAQLTTAGGQAYRLDLHVGHTGNTLVVAPVRTGKSTLLSFFCWNFHRYGDVQIFAFDVDAAMSALGPACLAAGGDVLSFERGELALQPLADLEDPDWYDFIHGWLMWLLDLAGVTAKSTLTRAALERLLSDALDLVVGEPKRRRTMDMLVAACQHPDLKDGFRPYAGSGAHAHLVNASADRMSAAHWVTFELTALRAKGDVGRAVLRLLMWKVMRRLDGRPTMIPIDEAWLAFRDMPEELDEWLRRFPKHNAFLVLATHDFQDISNAAIAATLRNNCKTKIALANAEAANPENADTLKLYGIGPKPARLIASMAPKRDVYVMRPDGRRLAHLDLDPVELALCGSAGGLDEARRIAARVPPERRGAEWLRHKAKALDEAAAALLRDEADRLDAEIDGAAVVAAE